MRSQHELGVELYLKINILLFAETDTYCIEEKLFEEKVLGVRFIETFTAKQMYMNLRRIKKKEGNRFPLPHHLISNATSKKAEVEAG